jgi:hypothetical protein
MTSTIHDKRWVSLAIITLVLVAFAERFAGLGFLLPHEREADTAMVHVAAFHDRPAGTAPSDAAYESTLYPLFFPRVLIALPGSNWTQAASSTAPLSAHLAAASNPYMRARRLIALLSLLIIPCTYLLARRWLEPWWAVFAASLATTSLLVLEVSQQAKPHGGLAGTNALALVGILGLLRSSALRTYLWAGVASGLAVASLNSGCFVLPSLALAHWLAWRKDRNQRRWLGFVVALIICAAFFVIAYPYILFGDPLRPSSEHALNFGQQSIHWDSWGFQGFLDMVPWMSANDPLLMALLGVGFVTAIAALALRRLEFRSVVRPENLVLGLHAAITVVLFGLHERFYPRYFIPLVPTFCIVGAAALRAICNAFTKPATTARRVLGVALGCAALAFPAYATAWFATLRARDDTETLAARWIEEHVSPEDPVAVDFSISLPLLQHRETILELPSWSWRPWQRYQVETIPAEVDTPRWNLHPLFQPGMLADKHIDRTEINASLARTAPAWAVVSVLAEADAQRDDTRLAVRQLGAELVERILPYASSGQTEPLSTRDLDPHFLTHLMAETRLGPAIEIYRIPH